MCKIYAHNSFIEMRASDMGLLNYVIQCLEKRTVSWSGEYPRIVFWVSKHPPRGNFFLNLLGFFEKKHPKTPNFC